MATMDITPQELRDIEIREAWRGYHRDDVDELLERAAATIEHLEDEIAQLHSRPSPGPQIAAPTPPPRPAPQSPPQPVPQAAPQPAPAVRTADTDVIQRTLVLAQKAADEAVAEAKAKAGQIVTESEAKAAQLVADAEQHARRIAETEKGRLEEEINKLMEARETLSADVDALERFEADYRERMRVAIEAELEQLSRTSGAGASRPALREVDLPEPTRPVAAAPAPVAPAAAPAAPVEEGSWSASQEGVVAVPAEGAGGPPTVHIEAVAAYPAADPEPAWDPAPAGGWDDGGDQTQVAGADLEFAEEEMTGESLDDDAFFASLREAVRDDAPLGGGETGDDTGFFDQEDTDQHRGLFKRRR
jgi:DivIVA domain-containing protein